MPILLKKWENFLKFTLFWSCFLGAVFSFAGQKILLQWPLQVYDQPDTLSGKVTKTLKKGTSIEAFSISQSGFMRVQWAEGESVKTGYALYDDLNANMEVPLLELDKETSETRGLPFMGTLSLAYFVSSHSQGGRVSTIDSASNEVTSVKGVTVFPEVRGDLYISSQWALRLGASLRKTDLSGNIKPTTDGATSSAFSLKQSFVSWSLMARYFMDGRDAWWVGFGYEGAKVTSAKLTIDGNEPASGVEKPFYQIATANFGYNFNRENWVLGLETELGLVWNTKPNLLLADFGLSVGYRF